MIVSHPQVKSQVEFMAPEGKEGVICSAARPLPWGKDAK